MWGSRRRRFAAEEAARLAAVDASVPGLDQFAATAGWDGPLGEVGLDTALQCVGELALALHGAFNPDRKLRFQCRQEVVDPWEGRPTLHPVLTPHGPQTYRGRSDGRTFILGNLILRLPGLGTATGSRAPQPPGHYVAVAFCRLAPVGRGGRVDIIPALRGVPRFRFQSSGHPELDEHYSVEHDRRGEAARVVGPELAAFVAQRQGWAFSLYRGELACVTHEPLASGEDARRLLDSTVRAAELLGR